MKKAISIFLFVLCSNNSICQILFSPFETKLQTNSTNELLCSNESISIKFPINRKLKVSALDNFVTIDNQVLQIKLLKFEGFNNVTKDKKLDNQKKILASYSKYEIEYFKNNLNVEIINPNNQWVLTKSKGWYIWYFKVGKTPEKVDKQIEIQLFSTTIIGDKILIINAPILINGDFSKAALIVNEMINGLKINHF
jgi:hypothetical protein